MKLLHARVGAHGFSRVDLIALMVWALFLGLLGTQFLQRNKQALRLAVCQSNLGQVGQAVLLYANDHSQRLPGPNAQTQGEFWWWYKEQIVSYVKSPGPTGPNNPVFACPMDRGYSDPGPFFSNGRFDHTSYVFNGVMLPQTPNIANWPVASLAQPTRTLLVMEWAAHAPLSWHRSRTGQRNAPFYRDAESVVAFADGHAGLTKIYYDGYNAAYTRDPIPGYAYRFSGK